MRKIGMFLALILMSALSFGQAPPQKGDPAYPAYFDKAYYNHQSPAVRELLDGASNGAISQGPELPGNSRRPAASWASYAEQDARTVRAIQLATTGGEIIDVPIDVWGWDPFKVMFLRESYGYTWVPSALQGNVALAPGLSQPGVAPYDPKNPPPGAVIVSTNAADFPPLVAPPPAANAPTVLVGGPIFPGSKFFYNVAGDNSPDGTKYSDARGTFTKHVYITPFGKSVIWEQIA